MRNPKFKICLYPSRQHSPPNGTWQLPRTARHALQPCNGHHRARPIFRMQRFTPLSCRQPSIGTEPFWVHRRLATLTHTGVRVVPLRMPVGMPPRCYALRQGLTSCRIQRLPCRCTTIKRDADTTSYAGNATAEHISQFRNMDRIFKQDAIPLPRHVQSCKPQPSSIQTRTSPSNSSCTSRHWSRTFQSA